MIKLIKIWLLKERIKEQDSYQHWLWAKYWNKARDRYISKKKPILLGYMTTKEVKELEKEINKLFDLKDELKKLTKKGAYDKGTEIVLV